METFWIILIVAGVFLVCLCVTLIVYRFCKRQKVGKDGTEKEDSSKCICGSDKQQFMRCVICHEPVAGCPDCLRRLSPCSCDDVPNPPTNSVVNSRRGSLATLREMHTVRPPSRGPMRRFENEPEVEPLDDIPLRMRQNQDCAPPLPPRQLARDWAAGPLPGRDGEWIDERINEQCPRSIPQADTRRHDAYGGVSRGYGVYVDYDQNQSPRANELENHLEHQMNSWVQMNEQLAATVTEMKEDLRDLKEIKILEKEGVCPCLEDHLAKGRHDQSSQRAPCASAIAHSRRPSGMERQRTRFGNFPLPDRMSGLRYDDYLANRHKWKRWKDRAASTLSKATPLSGVTTDEIASELDKIVQQRKSRRMTRSSRASQRIQQRDMESSLHNIDGRRASWFRKQRSASAPILQIDNHMLD